MPLRIGWSRRRSEAGVDEPVGARLVLLAGRSPDEQFDLLGRLGCLSERGQGDRMGVILLLSRPYEAQVARGYRPPSPLAPPEPPLAEIWAQETGTTDGEQTSARQLARLQSDALTRAGYLNPAACRVEPDDVEAWWTGVLPQVTEVRQAHDQIFAAIEHNGTLKPGQRTDPITCPLCGRPAPRGATYCVWCGRWLAAPFA